MRVPQEDFMSVVERMSHALEEPASVSGARAQLRDVVACAQEALALERVALVWLAPDGRPGTQTTLGRTPEGPESSLVRPVVGTRGGCRGLLVGCAAGRRAFGEEELRRFSFFAQLAGLTLERTGPVPWDEAEHGGPRLLDARVLAAAFAREPTREELARTVLALGLTLVGAVSGAVHQLPATGDSLECVAAVGAGEESVELAGLLLEDEVGTGTGAVLRGTPVWSERRVLLPLRVEGRWWGVLTFGFASGARPGPDADASRRALLCALGRRYAEALEQETRDVAHREAHAEAEAAQARLRLLGQVGRVLSGASEWTEAVGAVAQLAVEAFADWCAVDFLDEHGALRRLTVRQARPERARREGALAACLPGRARPSLLTEVVRSGRARLLTGLGPEEDGQGALLVVPLVARQRTLGALSLVRGPSREPFVAADRVLAGELAARVGGVIDQARLLREARAAEAESRRHAARLRTFGEVDRLLAEAGLDLRAVLDVVVHQVSEVLGDGCVVQLTCERGTWLEPVALHHPDPEALGLLAGLVHARRQRPGEGLHGGVALRGQAVLLSDLDAAAARDAGGLAEYVPYLERQGAQSLLVVPLVARRRVCGTLGVVRDMAGGQPPYGEEELTLLRGLAERVALAVADARAHGAATEAVRLRDGFLSVAGHELKTPLSALRLQLQMLARLTRGGGATPELSARVARVERTSERLGALVDALLDAGRLSAGPLLLEREELDLAALARDAVGRMAESGGCEVRLRTDAAAVGQWDRGRLEQVLGNLLSNAAKYGRGRPVEVRVEAPAQGDVRLVVQDEGIGIAPADQPRIFERFERAVTDPRLPGLGLGLWISREIIDAHGGSIHVHSTPGQGSTFTVELPRE